MVIFPTDTVYGLGTNPRSVEGIKKCYALKKRDTGKKMPVLFSDLQTAMLFAKFGEKSKSLGSAFWPGKLTIILPSADSTLPQELVGPDKTVAARVPNHACCLRLIAACGGSLIGTSANISGEESFTDPYDPKLAQLSTSADYFVSGVCGQPAGLSSTIVDATNENAIRIIREGAIPAKTILSHLENISKTDLSSSAT